jgi:hypothetical protein
VVSFKIVRGNCECLRRVSEEYSGLSNQPGRQP